MRRRGAEAPGRCAGRGRSDPRGHPGLRREPGRAHERTDRAERALAERPDPVRADRGGGGGPRDRVRGSPRHRDAARRPDRGGGACGGPRGPRDRRAVLPGLGQGERGASGRRGGHRGPDQGDPRRAARDDPAPGPVRAPQPAHLARGHGLGHLDRAARVAREIFSPARRRQLVRLVRHQCARRGGAGASGAGQCHRGDGAAAARGLGSQPGGAPRGDATLPGLPAGLAGRAGRHHVHRGAPTCAPSPSGRRRRAREHRGGGWAPGAARGRTGREPGRRAGGATGRLRLPGAGLAVARDGARAPPVVSGLPSGHRGVRPGAPGARRVVAARSADRG